MAEALGNEKKTHIFKITCKINTSVCKEEGGGALSRVSSPQPPYCKTCNYWHMRNIFKENKNMPSFTEISVMFCLVLSSFFFWPFFFPLLPFHGNITQSIVLFNFCPLLFFYWPPLICVWFYFFSDELMIQEEERHFQGSSNINDKL